MYHRSLFALAVGLLSASTLPAASVYSDFTSSDTYTSGGWNILGSAVGGQSVAAPFEPSVTATLDSIDVVLNYAQGTNSFQVAIASDSSGSPGAVLESFSPVTGVTGTPTAFNVTSSAHPTLATGTTYWVEVLPGAADTSGNWYFTDSAQSGSFAYNLGSGWLADTSDVPPAFDVNGTATSSGTPEPASGLLLLTGAALLVRIK